MFTMSVDHATSSLSSVSDRNYSSDSVTSGSLMAGETNASTIMPEVAGQAILPGFIDRATRETVIEVVNCYVLPVLVLLGLSGNLMSLVVLLVHGMTSSTNVLLLSLTLSDLGFLLTMYARKVSCIVSHFDVAASRYIETGLIPNVFMVHRIFSCTTPFLTMLITLERCLAVTFPLKVQSIVTSFRMKLVVCFIYVMSTVVQFPFFFIYQIHWAVDKTTGQSFPRLAGTPFFTNNFKAITAFNNIVLSLTFNYLPMGTVVVCTIIVLVTVRKSARWRKTTSKTSDNSEEGRMTRLLMTVVAVYIGCYIPRCAVLIANSLAPDTFNSLQGRYSNLFYVMNALQVLLYTVNSSCNFVIYMLLSSKFFHTYKRIFLCRRKCGRREDNLSALISSNRRVTSISGTSGEDSLP